MILFVSAIALTIAFVSVATAAPTPKENQGAVAQATLALRRQGTPQGQPAKLSATAIPIPTTPTTRTLATITAATRFLRWPTATDRSNPGFCLASANKLRTVLTARKDGLILWA